MGLERRYRKDLWQKVISRDADGCPDQKRRCQIGHPAPDILTGVARRHGPGSVFRFAGWAPTGPGPARAVLGWPAGACWRPQQPKHGLHTPPELWNAFGGPGGGLGCLCHSEVAPCSNSLYRKERNAHQKKIGRPKKVAPKGIQLWSLSGCGLINNASDLPRRLACDCRPLAMPPHL